MIDPKNDFTNMTRSQILCALDKLESQMDQNTKVFCLFDVLEIQVFGLCRMRGMIPFPQKKVTDQKQIYILRKRITLEFKGQEIPKYDRIVSLDEPGFIWRDDFESYCFLEAMAEAIAEGTKSIRSMREFINSISWPFIKKQFAIYQVLEDVKFLQSKKKAPSN